MKTLFPVVLALCTSHFVLGCNKQSDSRTSGWGVAGTSYGGNTLNVCYESRGFADRELVNVTGALFAHARDQFARTNLSLQGFGPCGPKSSANEIRLTWWDAEDFPTNDPENIRNRLHGMSQIGNGKIYGIQTFGLPQRIPSTVRAEPTLALNSHIFKTTQSKIGISTAISEFQSTFLHEMGHAVGMLHEHAQAKTTCSKTQETAAVHFNVWKDTGNANSIRVVGTSYDPYSIMNYCYIFERNSAVAVGFSTRDIQTVNALYPKPVAQPTPQKPISSNQQVGQQQDEQPQVGQPQVGQPQVGQPQVGQPPVGAFKPSDGYGNCNNSQLANCEKYGGGAACYPKHCECIDLEICGSPGL
ncbi:MAG: Astacin [Pseudomonadota bacterium]